MKWFKDLDLRAKLIAVILAITCTTLILASAVQALYQRAVSERSLIAERQVVAQLIANRSTAALSFSDERVARENLSALNVDAAVQMACIYDAQGGLFADYKRQLDASPDCPSGLPSRAGGIANGELFVVQPIHLDGERVGTLTILASLATLSQRTRSDLLVALAILLGAMGLAVLAALRLQRIIFGPIIQLAETARRITQSGDFGLRARATTDDEVGQLVKTFNGMLDAIHERDASLRRSIELLRVEVARREAAETQATEALEQLQQAFERSLQVEKLSALGTFVGGIAHEINNPLMGLSNFISFAQKNPNDPEHAEILEQAQELVRRIARIVDRVLRYGRPGTSLAQPIDLSRLVADACLLLKPEFDRWGIKVEVNRPEPPLQVISDKDVLDQALVNLLLNAIYAVKQQARREIHIELKPVTGGAAIGVADTGSGVPAAVRCRIYDPFFTTKPPGQGTGLGLSVTMRGLLEAGASLKLDEAYQDGARFVIFVPDRPSEPYVADRATARRAED